MAVKVTCPPLPLSALGNVSFSLGVPLSFTAYASSPDSLLGLLCRAGPHLFVLGAARVERVLQMAALTPHWPVRPPRCGLLNVAGEVLPVIDARQVAAAPSAEPDPAQKLVLLTTPRRHLLWVDEVLELAWGTPEAGAVLWSSGRLWPLLTETSYPLEEA